MSGALFELLIRVGCENLDRGAPMRSCCGEIVRGARATDITLFTSPLSRGENSEVNALRLLPCTVVLGATLVLGGCFRDPCEVDIFEDNESFDEGSDLGDLSDQGTRLQYDLTLDGPDDTDVFFFNVLDQGIDGNPMLDIWVDAQEDELISMELDYRCTSDGMENFDCTGEIIGGDEDGFVCLLKGTGSLHMQVSYDCSGDIFDDTDNGFAVLTVRRDAPAQACAAYDLEIRAD